MQVLEKSVEENQCIYSYEWSDLSLMPKRKQDSHKGSYGRVLVIAGQKNMAGAAYFSAKAAALCGCGLVKIFTVEENRTILQQLFPEAILSTYSREEHTKSCKEGIASQVENSVSMAENSEQAMKQILAKRLQKELVWADVIVIGPGLGTDECAAGLVEETLIHAEVPVVIDADALNILAMEKGRRRELLMSSKPSLRIVTPHMGEMARLCASSISDLKQSKIETARTFANTYHVTCVLKDVQTVTACQDGTVWINRSGNNGMATGGSGDVLTGIIAGLLAQGMQEEAAPFGVYLHGLAGDQAKKECGSYSLLAGDLLSGIRQVTRAAEIMLREEKPDE